MTSREGQWREGEWGRVITIMVVTLIAGGGGVFVLARVLDRTDENRVLIVQIRHLQDREREGRIVASTALCAVSSAIADAGRRILLSDGRRREARAYVNEIRRRVVATTGREDLVRHDGTLDCQQLRVVRPTP